MGKGKKGKAKPKDEEEEERRRAEEAARLAAQKQAEEEERRRKWDESWKKKIEAEERLEDCKVCCAPDEFYAHPRVQSNMWLQIKHEKTTQHVQMSFMDVPVPKPPPPPLPRLPPVVVEEEKKNDTNGKVKKKKKK